MQRNRLKIDLKLQPCRPLRPGGTMTPGEVAVGGSNKSLQTPCTEFVAKELRTPEVDGVYAVRDQLVILSMLDKNYVMYTT